eukprot:gene13495-14894_t
MDGTKLRIISWLMSNINSLVALAQLNSMLAVHCDNLFQIEQQQLLSVVDQSTAKILRLRKQIKKSSSKRRVRRFWERPGRKLLDDEEEVPICIIGDAAYPLYPYLMKDFPGGGLTLQEQLFGYKLCSARVAIECAFGRLKARFGILKREMDISFPDLQHVIHSCFILNNYCEMQKESVWEEAVQRARTNNDLDQPRIDRHRGNNSAEEGRAKRIRDIFVKYCD